MFEMTVKLIKKLLIFYYTLFIIFSPCLLKNKSKNRQKNGKLFDYKKEYSESFLSKVYSRYLFDKNFNNMCNSFGKASELTQNDLQNSLGLTEKQINEILNIDQDYILRDQRPKQFAQNLNHANYQSLFNQILTKNLIKEKCLTKSDSVLNLRKESERMKLDLVQLVQSAQSDGSGQFVQNNQYCDIDSQIGSIGCKPNYKYRTIDGKCNNLVKTNWGSSFQCQRRLLPPDYADGISQLRTSISGSQLPNARLLSQSLLREKTSFSKYSLFHTMFGQFIAHDTFLRVLYFGGALNCCPKDHSSVHPECLQIDAIPSDGLSVAYNQSCINLMRTLSCNTCSLGHRNHLGQVTSFLDLSQIYGFTKNISDRLRTKKGGELKTIKTSDGFEILSKVEYPTDQDIYELGDCNSPVGRPEVTCFKSGDFNRGNQNPAGTAIEVIMVRRHNQHCRALAKLNPNWDDERLFQEARRLLIAEYNQIIFGEYLPTILDKRLMNKFNLNIKTNGFTKYNPNVDPTGIQSVGGAAFRFGHLTTTGTFHVLLKPQQNSYTFKLRDKFGEMSDIWDGKTNGIIKGLIKYPEKQIGPNVVEDLSNHLFMDKLNPDIKDLAAFNIQRGRDYGLPSYVHYIHFLSGKPINNWNDLKQYIPNNYIQKLIKIYEDYRDIDLYVGGVLENEMITFKRLIAIQFHHWKFGDRFYFEHSDQSGSFNKDQLNNIRKRGTLSNLLCRTTDIQSINSNPFAIPSKTNPLVMCNRIPELDHRIFKT